MKVSPPNDVIAMEVEAWALEVGWKTVGVAIADQYHTQGGGSVLPLTICEDGIRNAVQRVKRIFRGFDGPRYAPLANILAPSALAALPAERRVRIKSPGDPTLLAALAAREGVEAVNAVNLGAEAAIVLKEIDEAISALFAVRRVFEPRCVT